MNVVSQHKAKKPATGPYSLKVLRVKHYTDRLFWFEVERPQGFRFRSGEFVMIGLLQQTGKPLLRAYSIASPGWAETLEFYSIKVPDGPLTSQLQKIQPGDEIIMARKSTGTLVHDALKPGKNLYMFSTGTGIAPFASVIRDPETYEKFDKVILTQTCRLAAELEYGNQLVQGIRTDALLSEIIADKLIHFTSVTRDDYHVRGRITDLITNGRLFDELAMKPLNSAIDRVMICGSIEMLADIKALCEAAGLSEGSNAKPADFVIEKAFAG